MVWSPAREAIIYILLNSIIEFVNAIGDFATYSNLSVPHTNAPKLVDGRRPRTSGHRLLGARNRPQPRGVAQPAEEVIWLRKGNGGSKLERAVYRACGQPTLFELANDSKQSR